MNLCCATTAGFGNVFPYLSVVCSDIANNIGTKVYLNSSGAFWTGYNFNTRMIIDSSFSTNSGLPNGGTIYFQTSDTNNVSANTYKNMCYMNTNIMYVNNNLGIQNTNPQAYLHLGNCDVSGSNPAIVFGKNNGEKRNAHIGYTDTFFFTIGDWGNQNAGPNTLTSQLAIVYSAPYASLVIGTNGYVTMQYGSGGASDERIKTNIKTIEYALDKVLLLRGVEYNDFRIEPERKRIGLIAQEVELIVPEVVRTSEEDGMKSIEYQNLVGLLIEAIKDQQKQINELKNILKNNNLI
jgi:hypothetical protein